MLLSQTSKIWSRVSVFGSTVLQEAIIYSYILDIPELVNLQEVKGEAKPYQIRQFLRLVERHNLHLEEEQ